MNSEDETIGKIAVHLISLTTKSLDHNKAQKQHCKETKHITDNDKTNAPSKTSVESNVK